MPEGPGPHGRGRVAFVHGVTWQMAVGVVGVAAGAALLIAFLMNVVVWTQFSVYLRRSLQQRVDGMAGTLASTYQQGIGWDTDVTRGLTHWTMMEDLEAQLLDAKGRVIWDSAQDAATMGLLPMPGYIPGDQLEPLPYQVQSLIIVRGERVGTLVVRAAGAGGIFSQHDFEFRQTVNHWLLGAVLVVSAVALLFSLVLAQHLTRPLLELNRLAQRMKAGNWHLRVEPSGATEVAELAVSLNSLAATLERQEETRRHLTSDLAHELRTPLANVRSHLQAIVDGVWEASPERLQSTLDEVVRLTGLVGDLERLTRAEAASLRLELGLVSLQVEAARAVEFFSAVAHEGNVELEWRDATAGKTAAPRPREALCVVADRNRVQQVLANLISNALKYTPEGGRVTVTVLPPEPGHDEGGLAVADTGTGIPAAELPLIFERFYRGELSQARHTGGAGLGLTIVQILVTAMHGRVEVVSEEGKGSTFTVWLPLSSEVSCSTD